MWCTCRNKNELELSKDGHQTGALREIQWNYPGFECPYAKNFVKKFKEKKIKIFFFSVQGNENEWLA